MIRPLSFHSQESAYLLIGVTDNEAAHIATARNGELKPVSRKKITHQISYLSTRLEVHLGPDALSENMDRRVLFFILWYLQSHLFLSFLTVIIHEDVYTLLSDKLADWLPKSKHTTITVNNPPYGYTYTTVIQNGLSKSNALYPLSSLTTPAFRRLAALDRLSELTILSLTPRDNTLVQSVAHGLRSLVSLRTITVPYSILCNALFQSLALLPTLEVMTISVSPKSTPTITFRALKHCFSSLKTLDVSTRSPREVLPVLRACVHPETSLLQNLDIKCTSLLRSTDIPHLANFLSKMHLTNETPNCRLVSLEITIQRLYHKETAPWMNVPLFAACESLRVFKIVHPRPLVLSDADVALLLHAWKDADTISLNPHPTEAQWIGGWEIPTLGCLVHVAENFGWLSNFGVIVDPLAWYEDAHDAYHSAMRRLDVGYLGQRTTHADALVRRMFPNAEVM